MNALLARASLKRSPRTRTRKASISEPVCPPSRSSSTTTCDRGRPLPLHIIPELSENDFEFDSDICTPKPDQPHGPSSRLTLSAFPFSIDDALLMLNDEPRSPALSASSSTEGSEALPTTPGASDDEDLFELCLPSPRLRPHHIEIRPLCITKTRSIMCVDGENITDIIDNDQAPNAIIELSDAKETQEEEEDDHDFYTRRFQDFISLYSTCSQVCAAPARRDSIILSLEHISKLPVEQPNPRGRSRFSKALPRLPIHTPPSSTLPPVPPIPASVPTVAKHVKRDLPAYPPPLPPVECRPPPRMSVPFDIRESNLFEEEPLSLDKQIWFDDDDEESICSPSSSTFVHNSVLPLPPALPETPANEIYLPRASTDSDAPRSSLDSHSSCHSSSSERTPISPFSFPPTPIEKSHQLRSRWSSSTLDSLNFEPPRTAAILSPLRNVFSSKPRRLRPAPLTFSPPPTHTRAHSKMPLTRMVFPATPSPPSTPSRRVRRQNSRSSTSSQVSSECESCESGNSSSGLRRKPIPVEMFLRA